MSNNFLNSTVKLTQYYQSLGNKTIQQLEEDDLHWTPGENGNSIAVLVRHVVGNIHSRFTNFLTEDGEKPWRNRDSEFEDDLLNKSEISAKWNEGWEHLQNVLKDLAETDLEKTVYIRNEGHSVTEAIQRQLAHYAYHVGQIVVIGKMIRGNSWQSLSIPKNQSDNFNKKKFEQEKQIKHFTDNE
ncbi:MAG: DinB family protein [Cyclobacteriaceae bacterium]